MSDKYDEMFDEPQKMDSVDMERENLKDRGDISTSSKKSKKNKKTKIFLIIVLMGLVALVAVAIIIGVAINLSKGNVANVTPAKNTKEQQEEQAPSIESLTALLMKQKEQDEAEKKEALEKKEAERKEQERLQGLENNAMKHIASSSANASQGSGSNTAHEISPITARRLDGEVLIDGSESDEPRNATGAVPERNNGEFSNSLKGDKFDPTTATRTKNMDFLLRRGTMIPCVIQNDIIQSGQTGFSSCIVTQDVYSSNRRVVLLERNTIVYGVQKIVGYQGKGRIYIVWSDIETPRGVRAQIDSLGTDTLGSTGIDAYVDNHFWDKFGNSLMLSLIDDGLKVAASRLEKNSSGDSISFDSTQDNGQRMAEMALQNTINIPQTLYSPQGELMSIRVVRDADFSKVYRLVRAQ